MLTAAQYTRITGDAAPAAFASKVATVIARLDDALGRPLTLDTRTERCVAFADGVVYPRATPVVSVDGYDTDGVAVYVGQRGTVTITYLGGFDADSCPEQLRTAIAWGVHTLNTPSGAVLPAGVQSLSIAGEYTVTKDAATILGADGVTVPVALVTLADLGGRCATLAATYRRR
jgi:hypothetical protein